MYRKIVALHTAIISIITIYIIWNDMLKFSYILIIRPCIIYSSYELFDKNCVAFDLIVNLRHNRISTKHIAIENIPFFPSGDIFRLNKSKKKIIVIINT